MYDDHDDEDDATELVGGIILLFLVLIGLGLLALIVYNA